MILKNQLARYTESQFSKPVVKNVHLTNMKLKTWKG